MEYQYATVFIVMLLEASGSYGAFPQTFSMDSVGPQNDHDKFADTFIREFGKTIDVPEFKVLVRDAASIRGLPLGMKNSAYSLLNPSALTKIHVYTDCRLDTLNGNRLTWHQKCQQKPVCNWTSVNQLVYKSISYGNIGAILSSTDRSVDISYGFGGPEERQDTDQYEMTYYPSGIIVPYMQSLAKFIVRPALYCQDCLRTIPISHYDGIPCSQTTEDDLLDSCSEILNRPPCTGEEFFCVIQDNRVYPLGFDCQNGEEWVKIPIYDEWKRMVVASMWRLWTPTFDG